MTQSEKVKQEQLGMAMSNANRTLTRRILFYLVQQLGRDGCFRCGQKIETVKELSIDHKKPWLHNDVRLFWDLDNIAFSHQRCNSGAGRRPKRRVHTKNSFAEWYEKPGNREKWNARRRKKYAECKMAQSTNG